MAVSLDLFGTLVDHPARDDDPAAAVARELDARGVPVPDDWAAAYRERHVDAPDGAEVPLPAHVAAALASRGVDPGGAAAPDDAGSGTTSEPNAVRRAVVAAFDRRVDRRPGAREAIRGLRERGHRVGLLSNCSVPGLVRRTLVRTDLREALDADAVVASVDCGWRKPDRRAFAAVAARLDVPVDALVHVGDDPRTDGGVVDAGGRFVDVRDVALAAVPNAVGDDPRTDAARRADGRASASDGADAGSGSGSGSGFESGPEVDR